jgi:LuxR family maltose regulon positive regulatory protein
VRARHELSEGNPVEARAALAPYTRAGLGEGHLGTRVEMLVLEAVARQKQFDHDGAAVCLERALALADPDDYRWPFVQAGPPLRDLLTRQIRLGTAHRALVDDLLVHLDRGRAVGAESPEDLLDPLSERERQVLRYLPTLLSSAEIAGELFVSVNTVKTHIRHIYRKLGTTRRRDAVVRARALRLL